MVVIGNLNYKVKSKKYVSFWNEVFLGFEIACHGYFLAQWTESAGLKKKNTYNYQPSSNSFSALSFPQFG